MPYLVATREIGHRTQCQGTMSEIGVSLLKFHESKNQFPPAATWYDGGAHLDKSMLRREGQLKFLRGQRPVEITRENWVYWISPFLLTEGIQVDRQVSLVDSHNRTGRLQPLSYMLCPSDTANTSRYAIDTAFGRASFARGNYALNGGSQNIFESPGWLTNPRPGGVEFMSDPSSGIFALWGNGVAGINRQFSVKDFENGLSRTVLLDEIRAGVSESDPRGTWALGQIGASITWGHGANGDDGGPNATAVDSDDIHGCAEMHQTLGSEYLRSVGMPCCAHCNDNNQATARSMHPNGVNVAMADGSVRFVTNAVDVGLWHVMHSRLTPEGVLKDLGESELAGYDESGARSGVGEKRAASKTSQDIPQEITNSIGMKFVGIPAGQFVMGLPNWKNRALYPAEAAPAHSVRISRPFLLGIHEVTQSQFEEVMGFNPSENHRGDVDLGNSPVEYVTWDEALEFCSKLSARADEQAQRRTYRLPTEAEWEYAARAGREGPIVFSPKWDDSNDLKSGVTGGKEWKPTIPIDEVGRYPANAFGIHDMCGNVFEWTNDWFSLDYYRRSPEVDPQGPEKGYLRVVRGSYWVFVGPACVANPASPPWERSPFIGFRVVCAVSCE